MALSLVSGIGPAAAIDGKGKVAAGSVAAHKEEASLSLVTRRDEDGGAAVAVVVVAIAAVAVASASMCEVAAAAGDASPVDAIGARRRGMVLGVLALGFGRANARRESVGARKCARWKKMQWGGYLTSVRRDSHGQPNRPTISAMRPDIARRDNGRRSCRLNFRGNLLAYL